jgi:hypothetical protein
MAEEDLAKPNLQDNMGEGDDWPDWMAQEDHAANVQDMEIQVPHHLDQPLDTTSFNQTGSTAEYLRANGPNIVLSVQDVLQGLQGSVSPHNSSSSAESKVQKYPCISFQMVGKVAFSQLFPSTIPYGLTPRVVLDRVSLNMLHIRPMEGQQSPGK